MSQALAPTARRRLLLDAARAAVELTDTDELADAMLTKLSVAFDTTVALVYRMSLDGAFSIFVPPHMAQTASAIREYGPISDLDPYHEVKMRMNTNISVISECCDRKTLERTPLASLYRRHDADRLLIAKLAHAPYGRPGMYGLLLGRSRRQRAFDRTQLGELAQIQPILIAAIERNLQLARLERERTTLAETLAYTQPGAVVAFDERARVLWTSSDATRLLAGRDVPRAWTAAIARLATVDDATATPLLLVDRVLHLQAALSLSPSHEAKVVLARLSPLTTRTSWLDELPPRLRRVLDLLLTGLGEKQIADRVGLRYGTTHQYVVEIYRRAGVTSRAELMARALADGGSAAPFR